MNTPAAPTREETLATLHALVSALGGAPRSGQDAMAEHVADVLDTGNVLTVQAGTGTGKSFAYLVPAVLSGRKVVVSTHGKRLQRQLVDVDLPAIARHVKPDLTYALLKGRGDYACQVRTSETYQPRATDPQNLVDEIVALRDWAAQTTNGDRSELEVVPSSQAWQAVSLGPGECPGASSCRFGQTCFAEKARQRARDVDVVVTNHHLLAFHLRYGNVLPEADLIIIDEAHELQAAVTAALQVQITGARIRRAARTAARYLRRSDVATMRDTAPTLDALTSRLNGPAAPADVEGLVEALEQASLGAAHTAAALTREDSEDEERVAAARQVDGLRRDLDRVLQADDVDVVWVDRRAVQAAPLDVSRLLARKLLEPQPVVLTSATLQVGGRFDAIHRQVGVDQETVHGRGSYAFQADSPFAYRQVALRYVAHDLPHPTRDAAAFDEAAITRCETLIRAAGGRTLALFSTTRARDLYAAALRGRLGGDLPVLVQGEAGDQRLIEQFRASAEASLFATLGYWQGVDVPGSSLSLVIIDRVPFTPPNDPLMNARQERAGGGVEGFKAVSVPAAAILMAQASGRLIRQIDDRGAVAVLDPRLAGRNGWSATIVASLPDMWPTTDLATTLEALRRLAAGTAVA